MSPRVASRAWCSTKFSLKSPKVSTPKGNKSQANDARSPLTISRSRTGLRTKHIELPLDRRTPVPSPRKKVRSRLSDQRRAKGTDSGSACRLGANSNLREADGMEALRLESTANDSERLWRVPRSNTPSNPKPDLPKHGPRAEDSSNVHSSPGKSITSYRTALGVSPPHHSSVIRRHRHRHRRRHRVQDSSRRSIIKLLNEYYVARERRSITVSDKNVWKLAIVWLYGSQGARESIHRFTLKLRRAVTFLRPDLDVPFDDAVNVCIQEGLPQSEWVYRFPPVFNRGGVRCKRDRRQDLVTDSTMDELPLPPIMPLAERPATPAIPTSHKSFRAVFGAGSPVSGTFAATNEEGRQKTEEESRRKSSRRTCHQRDSNGTTVESSHVVNGKEPGALKDGPESVADRDPAHANERLNNIDSSPSTLHEAASKKKRQDFPDSGSTSKQPATCYPLSKQGQTTSTHQVNLTVQPHSGIIRRAATAPPANHTDTAWPRKLEHLKDDAYQGSRSKDTRLGKKTDNPPDSAHQALVEKERTSIKTSAITPAAPTTSNVQVAKRPLSKKEASAGRTPAASLSSQQEAARRRLEYKKLADRYQKESEMRRVYKKFAEGRTRDFVSFRYTTVSKQDAMKLKSIYFPHIRANMASKAEQLRTHHRCKRPLEKPHAGNGKKFSEATSAGSIAPVPHTSQNPRHSHVGTDWNAGKSNFVESRWSKNGRADCAHGHGPRTIQTGSKRGSGRDATNAGGYLRQVQAARWRDMMTESRGNVNKQRRDKPWQRRRNEGDYLTELPTGAAPDEAQPIAGLRFFLDESGTLQRGLTVDQSTQQYMLVPVDESRHIGSAGAKHFGTGRR